LESPQWDGCDAIRFIQGFVPYSQAKRHLAPALRTLSNGHRWLPRKAFEYLAQLATHTSGTPKTARFTPREEAIILLLRGRLSNKEIAGRLHISERTVNFHLANVFDKLGVQDRHSVAELAGSLPGLNLHLAAA
jgi:DNA-binding NarL/FixJ family response regulator